MKTLIYAGKEYKIRSIEFNEVGEIEGYGLFYHDSGSYCKECRGYIPEMPSYLPANIVEMKELT